MTGLRLATALLVAGLFITGSAIAKEHDEGDGPITLAVFGDWPYNQILLDNANLLINSVNADRHVSLVMHVGDIHSGSQPCTSAGILPPIPGSNPGWSISVYSRFQQFNAPFVYTPGDNEWTDCHKTKEFASGDPLKELASVRNLFFARQGHTLGLQDKEVQSQATDFDPAHPEDAQFVENVMWMDKGIVFVTLNMPGGSNNDLSPWTNGFENPAAQTNERMQRTAADTRWLQAAFDMAQKKRAKAVVIGLQADMWDPEAIAPGGAGLDQYTPFVRELAALSVRFHRPVLLLNGDSHLFLADQPLADPTSAIGQIHHAQAVSNLTRIVVQGSTNAPAEWLRLTIDPRKAQPFSWVNVPYCANPEVSCP
jgi:hypothetical protein